MHLLHPSYLSLIDVKAYKKNLLCTLSVNIDSYSKFKTAIILFPVLKLYSFNDERAYSNPTTAFKHIFELANESFQLKDD